MDVHNPDAAPAPDLMNPPREVVPATEPPAQPPAPVLTLGDLEGMLNVISVLTKRGAFEPQELSQVGGLHDRIRTYVEHMRK